MSCLAEWAAHSQAAPAHLAQAEHAQPHHSSSPVHKTLNPFVIASVHNIQGQQDMEIL